MPVAAIALILVAMPIAAACHLLGGDTRPARVGGRAGLASSRWPEQGQAAIALVGGSAAVSPDQEPAPIASLAKVMTAYLTLQRYPLGGGEGDFTMTVSAAQAEAVAEEADEGQSVVAVAAGETLSERQLLEALLIPSGNNIARMLAVGVGGSEADFVDDMNEAADGLEMDDTTYTDPSGFDSGTVSTAADQLRVFRAAMHYAAFRRIVRMGERDAARRRRGEELQPARRAGYGGKTGSDSAAGGCLAFFTPVTVGGHRRTAIGVVMGQGEGSDTAGLLGAAASAAEGLVASVAPGRGAPQIPKQPMEEMR